MIRSQDSSNICFEVLSAKGDSTNFLNKFKELYPNISLIKAAQK